MRILQLNFRNLNSLTGDWELDFSHSAFTGDGIFAITGPTGAGKTTILDAICLALYGRTPRLDRVTKGGNEIMSRQSGDCSAEVVFSTGQGVFCCSWHQHRSRKKATGSLQPPRRQLSEQRDDDWEIIETSISKVAGRIEEITGMDFDRFTRSMLLAQGGFAAFLQASQDERAPILEQITGSAIYTQISMAVFERCRDERQKLVALEEQAAVLQLLTREEKEELAKELIQLRGQEAVAGKKTGRVKAALDWLARIRELKKELARLGEQQTELTEQTAEFAEDKKRLQLAEQALVLEGDHATLTSCRKQQRDEEKELDGLRVRLPEQEKAVAGAEQAAARAGAAAKQSRQEQEQGSKTIKLVRALDLQIGELEKQIREDSSSCTALGKENSRDQKQVSGLVRTADRAGIRLKVCRDYLNEHQRDQQLIEELAGIRSAFDRVRELDAEQAANRDRIEKAEILLTRAMQAWQQQVTSRDQSEKELQTVRQQLEQIQADREEKLKGRRIEELRNDQASRVEQRNLLTRLLENVQLQGGIARDILNLQEQLKINGSNCSKEADRLELLTESKESAEREVARQRQLVALAGRVRDLEAERKRLEDGKACPLCGSLEHPYAAGNVPAVDDLEKELDRLVQAVRRTEKELADVRVRLARLQEQEQAATARIRQQEQAASEAEQQQKELETALASLLDREQAVTPVSLQRLLTELDKRLAVLHRELTELDAVERKLAEISSKAGKQQEKTEKAVLAQERATSAKEQAEQEQKRLVREGDRVRKLLGEQLTSCRRQVEKYGISELPLNSLTTVLANLEERRNSYLAHREEAEKSAEQVAGLQTEIKTLEAVITTRSRQLTSLEQESRDKGRQLEELNRERVSLFADRDPDQEEQRLARLAGEAETKKEQLEKEQTRLLQERDQIRAAMQRLKGAITERTTELAGLESGFRTRLSENTFAGEVAYLAARLPEQERKSLAAQADRLRTRKTQLAERLQDRQKRLAAEEKRQLTETPLEQLQEEYEILVNSSREITGRIGAVEQQLQDNEQRLQQQQQLLAGRDAQQKEHGRWQMLDELIGSANGKKYRNFAQGLTFELMVSHANQQLRKMTDRYLLIRDSEQPLELNVIDSWQAGEVRSTKNLSGGESFVVSLALALGLSNMVGGNVRVDSLFLDEGFGALDEDALETALETLAGLRREGKLIGVISHVAALKERIASRIEVVPVSGGRSMIKGAGVRQIQ
jgi:exonuclease SbcC